MNELGQESRRFLLIAGRTRLLHWLCAFLVILAAGGFLILRPLGSMARNIEADIQRVSGKRLKIESVAKGAKDFNLILGLFEEEYRELKAKTLRAGQQAKVISELTRMTGDSEVTILGIKPVSQAEPSAGPEGSKLKPVFFEIHMAGKYKNFGAFLENLFGAPLIFTVEEFEAKAGSQDSPLLNIRMVLAAYEESL